MKYLILFAVIFAFSCGQNKDKQKESITDSTDISTDTTISVTYNFANHNDINIFIDDLSKAITNNDRAAVAQMTEFPFTDHWKEFLTGNENSPDHIDDFSAINSGVFLTKFDKLFIPELQNAIKAKKFRGYEKHEHVPDIIAEGEYLIMAEAPINKRQYGLAIRKQSNGIYKIYRTAFSS